MFEQAIDQENPNCKPTKKAKKLFAMSAAVDRDDFHHFRILSGSQDVPRKPQYGKTWMKQLFAGQMGLTLLMVASRCFIVLIGRDNQSWHSPSQQRHEG